MEIKLEHHLDSIVIPANLRINDQIKRYRKKCSEIGCHRPYHHFAFGQSPFSPPAEIINALRNNADKHSYLPTAGIAELRTAVSDYYNDVFKLQSQARQVIISPGSKEIISIILSVTEGDVLIPTPSWVSYLPQALILKKQVSPIRLYEKSHYKLTPALLEKAASQSNHDQHILILNNPNNPTGAVYTEDELKALATICRRHNIIVIADEIYARTSFDFSKFISMGKIFPEGTIVTGGLSKDRSAGGYRLGIGIFPDNEKLINDVLIIAGSTYSCVAAPIQYAALAGFSRIEAVEKYMTDTARIHAAIGRIAAGLLNNIHGVKATIPYGGFYLYVDFNEYAEKLKKIGFTNCANLCEHLIEVEHTALLPGNSLLLPEDDFSVRFSFVDYDGDAVLENWKRENPSSEQEQTAFFEAYCPLIKQGIQNIERYFSQVAEGRLPVHA